MVGISHSCVGHLTIQFRWLQTELESRQGDRRGLGCVGPRSCRCTLFPARRFGPVSSGSSGVLDAEVRMVSYRVREICLKSTGSRFYRCGLPGAGTVTNAPTLPQGCHCSRIRNTTNLILPGPPHLEPNRRVLRKERTLTAETGSGLRESAAVAILVLTFVWLEPSCTLRTTGGCLQQ